MRVEIPVPSQYELPKPNLTYNLTIVKHDIQYRSK